MLPNVLMNLDFAATAVGAEPPGGGGEVNSLLLLGVGRCIIPILWLYPFLRIF